MRLDDFDYYLPEELIAQSPAAGELLDRLSETAPGFDVLEQGTQPGTYYFLGRKTA